MSTPTLLPNDADLKLESIATTANTIVLHLRTIARSACCRVCGQASQHRHSVYRRSLTDLPWGPVALQIQLQSRKFYCDNPLCARRIFTEPVPALAARYGRRTKRLERLVRALGYALGGEEGARIAQTLGIQISADTLLERVRRMGTERAGEAVSVQVLGVDDWAFRRGHRYGTILVDLERHTLVDLLPDRTADSLAGWLQEHPGCERISRDRADGYAEGARRGAPTARSVADRWHLMANVGEALERVVQRHHGAVRDVMRHLAEVHPEARPSTPASPEPALPRPPTRTQQEQAARQERRQARYERVQALHQQGCSKLAIGRVMGMHWRTVTQYLREPDGPPPRARRRPQPSLLTPYRSYLEQRWQAGCHNAQHLLEELKAQGYTGSYSLLRALLSPWRQRWAEEMGLGPGESRSPARYRDPSPTSVRWWLLGHISPSDPERQAWQKQVVEQLCAQCSDIATARGFAERFGQMVRERQVSALDPWLAQAETCGVPEIQGIAHSLRQDYDAVQAALSCAWSNGQTEGQVNRLKLIKRQMYGRAKFDLLRARVLPLVPVA